MQSPFALLCVLYRGISMVEDASEDGRTVEAWHAEPRDGTIAANERGGPSVADQAVILDG